MSIARVAFYLTQADAQDDADFNSTARFVFNNLIRLFKKQPVDLVAREFSDTSFYVSTENMGTEIAREFGDIIFVIAEKNGLGRGTFNTFKQPFGKIKHYLEIRCLPPGTAKEIINNTALVAQYLDDYDIREGFIHEFIHYLDTLRHTKGQHKTRYDVRDLRGDSGRRDETDPEILKKRERFKRAYYSDPFEYNAIYHEGITDVIDLWRKLETDPINSNLYIRALRRKVPKRAQDFIGQLLDDNDRFEEMPPEYKRKFLRRLANLHQMIVPYIY